LPLVLTATARKSNRILSTPAISKLVGSQGNIQACRLTRQYPSLSAHKAISKLVGSQGCSDGKNLLDFSGIFFLRFVDFAVQFCHSTPEAI